MWFGRLTLSFSCKLCVELFPVLDLGKLSQNPESEGVVDLGGVRGLSVDLYWMKLCYDCLDYDEVSIYTLL